MNLSIFRSDLAKLTFEDLEAFCAEQIPESTVLDYKLEPHQDLVIKGASSLANTQGGVLIFGVRTGRENKLPILPIDGMTADPAFGSRVESWCLRSIYPPLPVQTGYVHKRGDPGKAFGVLRVEPSDFAHTFDGGKKLYVRRGDRSEPEEATFEERELLRNRRELARRLDELHAEDLRSRVLEGGEGYASMLLSVYPRFTSDGALPAPELFGIIREMERADWRFGVMPRLEPAMRSYSNGIIAKLKNETYVEGFRSDWRAALTTRGAFAIAQVVHRRDGVLSRIFTRHLAEWSKMASEWTRQIADAAGFWGSYDVRFEANGWRDAAVRDTATELDRPSTCTDNAFAIPLHWSSLDAREDRRALAAELFVKLLWAFGQGLEEWPPVGILRLYGLMD